MLRANPFTEEIDVYKRQVVRDYLVDYKLLIVIIKAGN